MFDVVNCCCGIVSHSVMLFQLVSVVLFLLSMLRSSVSSFLLLSLCFETLQCIWYSVCFETIERVWSYKFYETKRSLPYFQIQIQDSIPTTKQFCKRWEQRFGNENSLYWLVCWLQKHCSKHKWSTKGTEKTFLCMFTDDIKTVNNCF